MSVLFDTLTAQNGKSIGVAVLADEKSLNALNAEMIEALSAQLTEWRHNPNIAAVLIRGSGEKAFCAGGNIRALYGNMLENSAFPNQYALNFFSREYALDYQIHTYPKPIIAWASGIVMGGGLGVAAAAAYTIVTETTRMAMPEINIGLFPDAGGSWFLPHMPARSGLFLGLTGAPINGNDALLGNLADFALPADAYNTLLFALQQTNWQENVQDNHALTAQTLQSCHNTGRLPESLLLKHAALIHRITHQGSLAATDDFLHKNAVHQTDNWLKQAFDNYINGCPATAALVWRIFESAPRQSLPEIFRMELIVALHCCQNGDFQEGVRALLVDKDKNPRWQKKLSEYTADDIDRYFVSPFAENEHPFAAW